MAILADLKDPRVSDVTVTYVEVSADMRHAKVHVSVMGDETKQNLCLCGLQNSSGYLQKKISKRIDTRYTPRLHFELDMGVKKSIEIAQLLNEVLPDPMPQSDESSDEPAVDVSSSGGCDVSALPPDVVAEDAVESDPGGEPTP